MNSKDSLINISEKNDFLVNSSSLKDVRSLSRDVFEKLKIENIVKHGYKDVENTTDRMEIKISLNNDQLEIGFFDKGKPVVAENVQHRKLDDIKPGGLGTFFIKQIMDGAVFKKDQKGWVNHLVLTKKI